MCGEITTVCTDCGAERFLFWDECKHYWMLYAAALRKGPAGAKPHPEDCVQHERVERFANLGTCPNLENCISKVKLQMEQIEAQRRSIAAARAQLERDKRDGRYKAAFAKRYFCKRPVPAVLPPASEPIEFFLDGEEMRQQREQEEQRVMERRKKAPEHQKAKKAVKEMLRRKAKPQRRARGCAVSSSKTECQSQSRDSTSSTQDSPSSTQLGEVFEVPDSPISLIVSDREEAVDAPDSGVSLTMPELEREEELHQQQSKPSGASSETVAIAEPNPKPSCPPIKQVQDTCQRIEGEAAAQGVGWGAGFGMVGYIWGRISAGLGIVR
ncbi:hypothetical protein TPAR_02984 [Tolypocladium paradoxum]|uniref:Uncharacterized protein n=1 Tax=Tolypocladium paradoxum TaxID=94208 RepID=A0A2S4L339_9HYPO|nr:hypothetical protein TPAR_02984 [Tolypocladium paradoxum]